MPQANVATQPFGWFSFSVVLVIVAVIFFIVYLYIRRKGRPPQIDGKAGDEGED
ncbi:MAG TPA: hypothetical protein VJ550_07210 [Geomonas sp.]|nr:hypothetical protein [Geomonas sp.]